MKPIDCRRRSRPAQGRDQNAEGIEVRIGGRVDCGQHRIAHVKNLGNQTHSTLDQETRL